MLPRSFRMLQLSESQDRASFFQMLEGLAGLGTYPNNYLAVASIGIAPSISHMQWFNVDPIWNKGPRNNNQAVSRRALQLVSCGGIGRRGPAPP